MSERIVEWAYRDLNGLIYRLGPLSESRAKQLTEAGQRLAGRTLFRRECGPWVEQQKRSSDGAGDVV